MSGDSNKAVCVLQDPESAERRWLAGAVDHVGETAAAAHSLATALQEAVNGLRETVAMHVSSCDKLDAQATQSRADLHSKLNKLEVEMVEGFAAIEQKLTARVASNRSWVVGLVIGIGGTVIVLLFGVIAWLINRLWERGLMGAADLFALLTL